MTKHDQLYRANGDGTFTAIPSNRPSGEGAKFDSDKVRLDLIDPEFELSMGRVLTEGAKVHGEYSWQTLPNAQIRYTAALKRHVNAMSRGELKDPTSGEFHAAHAAVNAMFLEWFHRNTPPEQKNPQ